jgi:signal transduction histidine kinase/CheY-like chemotaxis protein
MGPSDGEELLAAGILGALAGGGPSAPLEAIGVLSGGSRAWLLGFGRSATVSPVAAWRVDGAAGRISFPGEGAAHVPRTRSRLASGRCAWVRSLDDIPAGGEERGLLEALGARSALAVPVTRPGAGGAALRGLVLVVDPAAHLSAARLGVLCGLGALLWPWVGGSGEREGGGRRARRALVRGFSTRLREQLTPVVGGAELLREALSQRPVDAGLALDGVALVEEGAARVLELVDRLAVLVPEADLSAPGVDLAALSAARRADWSARVAPAVLDVELRPGTPDVRGDAEALGRVFQDVLANAAQSGARRVRWVASGDGAGGARVEVVDDGRGMEPLVAAQAMEPFFSASSVPGAFGLGLAVARAQVEALGGTVELETALGMGTRVRVSLPAAAARPVEPPPLAAAPLAAVLDADPTRCTLIARMLESEGFAVTAATDAEVAWLLLGAGRVQVLVVREGDAGLDALAAELEASGRAGRVVRIGGEGVDAAAGGARLPAAVDRAALLAAVRGSASPPVAPAG